MSTYCSNELEIAGSAELVAAFVADVENEEELLSLDNLLPEPDIGDHLGGSSGWIAWRVAHWGTKWDASEVERTHVARNCVTYFYETAYGPAVTPLREASRRNPELKFTLSYASPGNNFAGNLVFVAGNVCEERIGRYSDICVAVDEGNEISPGYEAWRGSLSNVCATLEHATAQDAAEEVRRNLLEDGAGSISGIEELLLTLGNDRLLQDYLARPDVDDDMVWRLVHKAASSPIGGAVLVSMRASTETRIATIGRLASHLYAALRRDFLPGGTDGDLAAERCATLRGRIAIAAERGDILGYAETVEALSRGWGGDDLADFLDAALELHF